MQIRTFAALSAAAVFMLAGCGKGEKGRTGFRKAPVTRTDIVRTVEATGTVTPRNSSSGIPVGAQVNGRLVKLFVDYNSIVTNGQIVALIDPLVYQASYKSAIAQLHVNEANVEVRAASLASAKAELVNAEKTYARKKALVEKKNAPVSDLDDAIESLDRAKASVDQAEANLKSAKASVEQSRATSEKAKADLEYCTIVSPVNGVVIDRKVEEGETVVSSMNAVPVLTIAEDLKTIWIEAKIPEADVGNIKVGQPVTFTADAYRRKFKGTVKQIRKASSTTNNVVTFPVIIEAENPGEILFPGMTATLAIETARAENVTAVASAAFRFRPNEQDTEKISGEIPKGPKLWFEKEDGTLEAVAVEEGVADDSFVQVSAKDGSSLEGREAVIGYETARIKDAGGSNNPFMPKPPSRGTKGTAPEPKKK
ncbi:MAG: efflux RND transporter periplasmic adaptor subunit [Kiritimatiellae bacterium]|nr:efflux RND transporter periplasmic adaptor subunit [Kiritimatiellia bacterium]